MEEQEKLPNRNTLYGQHNIIQTVKVTKNCGKRSIKPSLTRIPSLTPSRVYIRLCKQEKRTKR